MSNTIQKYNARSAEIPFKLDKKAAKAPQIDRIAEVLGTHMSSSEQPTAAERNFRRRKITGISQNETDSVIFLVMGILVSTICLIQGCYIIKFNNI